MHDQHTIYSAAAAAEGRAMNSDEQRADRWARLAAKREADREPQGEAVRLFTPAPVQLEGQASMDLPESVTLNVQDTSSGRLLAHALRIMDERGCTMGEAMDAARDL
jgi:hypothetical protein